MKKALALAGLICVVASLSAGSLSAAPKARKFAPHQEPRGIGNLVARGDRVRLDYDAGVESATGFAYVRNDLRRRFVSLPLVAERGPATTYRARVPARLIRGHRLLYYAILRDPRTYRRARVPAQGTSSALILEQPRLVDSARIASARRGRRTRSWLVRARIRSAGNFRRRGRGPQQGPSRSS